MKPCRPLPALGSAPPLECPCSGGGCGTREKEALRDSPREVRGVMPPPAVPLIGDPSMQPSLPRCRVWVGFGSDRFRFGMVPCLVLSCPGLSCLVLSSPVLSCDVLSCLVLSCPVLFCLVLSCLVSSRLASSRLASSRLVLSCLVWSRPVSYRFIRILP